jgi:hypothetical protein
MNKVTDIDLEELATENARHLTSAALKGMERHYKSERDFIIACVLTPEQISIYNRYRVMLNRKVTVLADAPIVARDEAVKWKR